MKKLAAESPDTPVDLVEAVMADQPGGPARYEIWSLDQPGAAGQTLLLGRDYAASPLVAFRMDKAPRPASGWGGAQC